MSKRRMAALGAAGLMATILLVAGWFWAADRFGAEAAAGKVTDKFWQAVVAGDDRTAQGFLAPDTDQTAKRIVAVYGGFSYMAPARAVRATGFRKAQMLVPVLLIKDSGFAIGQITVLKKQGGVWVVEHTGPGYAETAAK